MLALNKLAKVNHETFIQAVQTAILARGDINKEQRDIIAKVKLVYGIGNQSGLRGITYFGGWNCKTNGAQPFIEVCGMGEEGKAQLACTTVHEFGHAIAGTGHGHDKVWRECCAAIGLRNAKVHQSYHMAQLAPWLRDIVARLDLIDGAPAFGPGMGGVLGANGLPLPPMKTRPCGAGKGTRGGALVQTSRLRKYVCGCEPPVIIRAATDSLACTCNHCSGEFTRA
jgi:hypothetical protein